MSENKEKPQRNFFYEFHVADERTCKAHWSCVPNGKAFFCAFCRHQFVVGDEYRAVYTNDTDGWGNPLVCRPCFELHGYDKLREIWIKLWEEYRDRFKWWAVRD